MASPCREPTLCQLYRHTFVPYIDTVEFSAGRFRAFELT